MLEVFEKCGINSYQKSRAIMATLFNAAFIANHKCTTSEDCPCHAADAVTAADDLLAELGIRDPDKTI